VKLSSNGELPRPAPFQESITTLRKEIAHNRSTRPPMWISRAQLYDLRRPSITVARPCFHQLTAPFKRIASLIAALNDIPYRMAKGGLDELTREARALPRPSRKARPEPVRSRPAFHAPQQGP
jgi:hypothetical protein